MSLAAAARAYLNLDLDKSLQTSDWNAPSPHARADRLRGDRRRRRVADRREDPAPLRGAEVRLRDPDRGRPRGHADGTARLQTRHRGACAADRRSRARSASRPSRNIARLARRAATPTLIDKAPSTPAQKENLLEVLLSSDELKRWRRTEKSGALSTKRSELMRAGHYPPILALAKLSRIDKMLSSFGQTLAALVSPVTGRIHAHYRIASTASGRASCAGPNLQQVPRDPRFRALFVPEPGNVFVIADYSSMELRAAAYISSDHAMTKAFEQGLDLHRTDCRAHDRKGFSRRDRRGAEGREMCEFWQRFTAKARAASFRAHGINSTSSWTSTKPRHGCRRSRAPIGVSCNGAAIIIDVVKIGVTS